MSRQHEKEARIGALRLLAKARQIRPDQAEQLEMMLRRCRNDDEFKQVSALVHQTCADNKKTRYGKIAADDDPLGLDDFE